MAGSSKPDGGNARLIGSPGPGLSRQLFYRYPEFRPIFSEVEDCTGNCGFESHHSLLNASYERRADSFRKWLAADWGANIGRSIAWLRGRL